MPTGRFQTAHKIYFNAIDGAYTGMTDEEVRKGTYNVKAVIREMAIDNNLAPAMTRSVESCNFNISDKVTGFHITPVNLTFKYSKPEPKREMTIYLSISQGIPGDKLADGNVWFIYFKANDPTPWLGIMTPAEWAAVTRATATATTTVSTTAAPVTTPASSGSTTIKSRIPKKTLSHDDLLSEKELDLELIDDIQSSEIPATATFEYSGKPKEKQEPVSTGNRKKYKRDKQTALNALIKADHKCEAAISILHPSFLRKRKDVLYMEPHHLIPLEYQDDFESSLDVEENIVSLCSNCHNQFHYGVIPSAILEKLYNERIEHLRCAGIEISLEDLFKIYLG